MEFTLFGKQYYINKVVALAVIIILIISSGVLGFFLKQIYQPFEPPVIEKSTEIIQSNLSQSPEESVKEEIPEIKVHVTGCVNKPGVVTIKKGQVIEDAVKMAGGPTKDADLENINLAYKLEENVMLRIKAKSLNKSSAGAATTSGINKPTQSKTSASVQSSVSNLSETNTMNSGVDIINDSLRTVVGEGEAADNSTKSSLVNINKASQAELENLPSVGPATAKAIVDYREKTGGFKKLTDIMKITGIKQKTYDKIKDFICID